MLGAIIGDVVGSRYEFNNIKTKDFPLFSERSSFTDDTVMTVAVAQALLETAPWQDTDAFKERAIARMREWGRRYPDAGYGGSFRIWLAAADPQPYNSWGNGSAMRVSSVGWLSGGIEDVRRVAAASAEVTHNHPEGIKGAEAVASAIYLARNKKSKEDIRAYIQEEFDYDLSRTCDTIRPGYSFDVSCQGSVPEAVIAFLESEDYEDAVRNAVSLGGDSDTIACIAGGIAEAYYGIPEELVRAALEYIPEDMKQVLHSFRSAMNPD